MYRAICGLLQLILFAAPAQALSIRHAGATSSEPFEFAISDPGSSFNLTLQIENSSGTPAMVLAWQLNLELRPVSSATGAITFNEVSAPSDPLFAPPSEPNSTPELPPAVSSLFVQDLDMASFEGEEIENGDARNIVQFGFSASPGASGDFQLLMPYSEDPETGSSWFDGIEGVPKTFENSTRSDAFPEFVLFGTIRIEHMTTVRRGDYNGDTNVTIDDYVRWRAHFGNAVEPGSDADGNGNSIVDAADYVVWRTSIEGDLELTFSATAVPEPKGTIHCGLSMICGWWWFTSQQMRRRSVSICESHT